MILATKAKFCLSLKENCYSSAWAYSYSASKSLPARDDHEINISTTLKIIL